MMIGAYVVWRWTVFVQGDEKKILSSERCNYVKLAFHSYSSW